MWYTGLNAIHPQLYNAPQSKKEILHPAHYLSHGMEHTLGARGGAVGWGTELQAGR